MRVEGRLERVRLHQAEGWVWLPDQPGQRVSVELHLDGVLACTVVADLARADLASRSVGDGRHGFAIPLPDGARGPARPASVAVRLVGGPELEGRIDGFTVPAAGRIESRTARELRGWAHGPDHGPADLEILADGRPIVRWPCRLQRNDPAFRHVGPSRFGFRLPLDQLAGEPGGALEVRIAGTSVRLDLPARTQDPGPIPIHADLPRRRYRTATEARDALVGGLSGAPSVRGPDHEGGQRADREGEQVDDGGSDPVLLSWGTLQRLLNTLSARENALEERRSIERLRLRARPGSRVPDTEFPAEGLLHEDTLHEDALQGLVTLSAEAPDMPLDELGERVVSDIVPAYRESPGTRARWLAALDGVPDRKLLRVIAKTFRQADFLEFPAVAYQASVSGLRGLSLASVRYARTLSSWANVARLREPSMPEPLVEPGARTDRTAYVLWRSVPHDTNGYAMRSHYLLRSLRSLDEDVVGVTRLGYPWDAEKKLRAGGHVERIDGLSYVRLGGPDASRDTMTLENYVIECSQRIAQAAAAMRADIVHSASNWVAGLPALRAARMLGVPFCYEVRGLWEITRASSTPGYRDTDHFDLFERMEGVVARNADLVFAITRQVKAELIRRGVDESRILLAPNGVEMERFVPRDTDQELKRTLGLGDEVVFGFIGTFAHYEGLLDLCRATTELARQGRRFKVLLIGDGGVYEQVARYKREAEGTDHLILTGRVPFETVPSYYSLIHAAVFPRTSNDVTEMVSPLKPFEAMAMGKPVIGSNVAPIAEIVEDGRTGWLFEKGSVESLVGVMGGIIDDPSGLTAMGQAARRYVETKHDWKIIAASIADGWQRLRAGGRHAAERPQAEQPPEQLDAEQLDAGQPDAGQPPPERLQAAAQG